MSLTSQERIPCRIGKYRILAHLKSGGMGNVYKAEDPETGQLIALKVLSSESLSQPKRLERFRREARQGARLWHENLVTLYDSGEDNGTLYLALEFIEGIDVEELIQLRGPLAPDEACNIATQVAKALAYAHGMGVVHRDVKPSNILMTERHGRCVAKLGDLGLARGGLDHEYRVTSDGTTVGTVDYMAPEQARDSGKADGRSDLYALGCSLYHMLSGSPPFAVGSIVERLVKHASVEPADLRRTNPRISDELWEICRRLLAKKQSDRYQSADELLVDLNRAAPAPAPPSIKRDRPLQAEVAGNRIAARSEAQRIVDGQFEHATRTLQMDNYDYGMTLLLNCCRLEPGNVAFHQALRQAQLARREATGLRPWCSLPLRWALKLWLRAAQQLKQPLQVLRCAERLLIGDPEDLATQLAMVHAAQDAGFEDLGIWLLENAHASHPDHGDVTRELACALEDRGELHRAFKLWKALASADACDCEAHKKVRDLAAMEWTSTCRASQKATRLARRTELDSSHEHGQ